MFDIDETKPAIVGYCAVVVTPNAQVVTTASDFSRSGYGGFSLEESQKIRVERSIKNQFARDHLNDWMSPTVDTDFAAAFWRLAERAGYTLHSFPASSAPPVSE